MFGIISLEVLSSVVIAIMEIMLHFFDRMGGTFKSGLSLQESYKDIIQCNFGLSSE
jgi:hypothetical protein